MLTAENLRKRYGTKDALRDVSLQLSGGEITVVLGPSGSGKSTFLRTLSMLEPPDHGRITFLGRQWTFPARGGTVPSPWPALTIVFQQLFLWPHLSLRQNICLPLGEHPSEKVIDHVQQLVQRYRMEDFIDKRPSETSLGQRQRAALARAIALEPRVLLLDEVTSALDVEHVSILLGHLKELRGTGMSIVLVTHLLRFARQSADRILFMDNGMVVEEGPPCILEAPRTERLKKFLSAVTMAW